VTDPPGRAGTGRRSALAGLRRHRRLLSFGAVGAVNTAVGLALYTLAVTVAGVPYLAALLLAHVASLTLAFPLHRRAVFRVRSRLLGDLWRYESVSLGSLLVNAALLSFAVGVLKAPRVGAELAVTGLLGAASYLAHRDFSFARPGL
jgi:putative flippase GtrA